MPDEIPDLDLRMPALGKGPREVLRGLAGADPDLTMHEALDFQREAFRADIGCYPEELVEVDNPEI